ncbi:MAG: glycosyltransferase [Flavobacteriales bacterium]|nr:glycosyltransferase [Flavobacteriales bacterium]MBK6944234.1 glycosyltransferase [Flavobacteriales bacterium]MBK7240434.1 glycosyltransferase [Flavobacteriales bacterium]MBP9139018.1 glycosyltransferase [Flavobacteriales bacterium]HQV52435.1 glycosyltransferase [Flavobacteriales bacterium]
MTKVSILLPFRNAASTLQRAFRSMIDQTFLDHELILIDNGSSDTSTSIAEEWCKKDQRIRLVREPTIGIAHALNTGLEHAKAGYIARMDADDIAQPERLQKQVEFLDTHPEIGVVGTRTNFISTVANNRGMEAYVNWQNAIITPREHYLKRFVDAPVAHPSVLFRHDLVQQFGGYDTGPLPEDHELWLRWMHHRVRFAKLPDELLTWNDHPQRSSRTHSNYSVDAFFTTKAKWIAAWYRRKFPSGRPVIIAGTSTLCKARARMLEHEGIPISAFTDVRERVLPRYRFILHNELPGPGEALIISFISQRGTGDKIAAFLVSRGLTEGTDFILAA